MRGSVSRHLAQRYAAWLDKYRILILVASVLVAGIGGLFVSQMGIRSDLTNLLPSSRVSVRDLTAVQKRARPFGTVQIVITGDDPARVSAASAAVAAKVAVLPADLVAAFSADDGAKYRYAWEHRFLLADEKDLIDARDALKERIKTAKLEANPLYIDLEADDDKSKAGTPERDRLSELEDKLADLESKATHPPPRASKDGKLHLLIVQTTFSASDPDRAGRLIDAIHGVIGEVETTYPDVAYGLTGNITMSMYEHDSVLQGMALSGIVTVLLCGIALYLYYRSGRIVLAMLWALGVGVAATFAIAQLMVGHLNVMTAFLFAIVVGNGINAGLIFVARYLEEVRASQDPLGAIASAIGGAMRGTLAATATAGVAYTSLLITDFRGFRQFGAIAGVGMGLTWIATFTVLPAALFVLARRGRIKETTPPAIGEALAFLLPTKRLKLAMVIGAAITAISLVITIVYIARDPFTHDWRDLQSSTQAIRETQDLNKQVSSAFPAGSELSGQAYQLAIAVQRRDQVAPLVARLRTADTNRPPEQRWIKDVFSLDDILPKDQDRKLVVLREITELVDDPKLQQSLSPEEKRDLDRIKPPPDLRPVVDDDVPQELAWPFIEKDGTRGRLVILRGASRFNSFNVDHRLEFAKEVRQLDLGGNASGTLAAGESLVVADIIVTMEHDAPRMIVFALLGSVLAVFVVIGLRRHGLVTLGCGMAGVVLMIAGCAIAGIPVHFLDLIALPITIGIGIDYAVNLAARDRQDGALGGKHLLRTTGGTVLLCSYTTGVGYATLLLSANGGIRAFGLAALIGEVACITMALVGAPAWLMLLRQRDAERQVGDLP